MALSISRLAADLEAKIRASNGLGATPYPLLTQYCTDQATAFINEVTNYAAVAVTVTKATAAISLSVPSVPNSQSIQPTNDPTGTGTIT